MFQQIVPTQGGFAWALVILGIQIGQMYNLLETFELSDDFREFSLTIKSFTAVLIAIDAEKYLRRELLNPVNHAPRTEVRRATRPERANRGGRQHRDHRLRNVRHVGHDAIARLYTQLSKPRRENPDLPCKTFPGNAREPRRLARKQERIGSGSFVS